MGNHEKVVGFTGPRKQPTPQDREALAVRLDEEAKRIRSGEVSSVAWTGVYKNGDIFTRGYWLPGENVFTLLGAISQLGFDSRTWSDDD